MKGIAGWLKKNWLITIVITWLATGLILLVIYLILYHAVDWQVLTGFATWELAGGLGIAIEQIRVTREATKKGTAAQLTVDYYWKFRNPETIEKIRSIYNLDPKDFRYKKNDIDYLLDWFDTLGDLVSTEVVDRQLVIEVFAGPPALRLWYILYRYIREERDKRGYYAENYESLVRLCLDYFEKHKIEAKLFKDIAGGRTVEVIDLVKELRKEAFLPRNREKINRDREYKKTTGDVPTGK